MFVNDTVGLSVFSKTSVFGKSESSFHAAVQLIEDYVRLMWIMSHFGSLKVSTETKAKFSTFSSSH